MKVLWVTFGLPNPPDCGVRLRDFHLIREVSRSARVILLSLVPHGGVTDPGELRDVCERVETWRMPRTVPPLRLLRGISVGAWRNFFPGAAARLGEIARAELPDVVQIEHSLLAAYRDAVPPAVKCRTVISLHNVAYEQYLRFASLEHGLPTRAAYRLKSWLMRRTEARYIPRFDCCVTVSHAESALVTRLVPSVHPAVIENGVDCAVLRPLPPGGAALLFAGMMNYPPNADAAVFFCRSILPLVRPIVPDVKLLIAGHSPPSQVKRLASEPGVTVAGYVEDMIPWYSQAAVTVAPLRAGGGTRLKILESMALGRPVVSTTIGCEGLEVEHNRHILIADTPERFAACVTRLLLDAALRERIAAEARRLVEERYNWPAIGKRLLDVYDGLAQESPSS
ncbi:MAG: glycosyltransferase family 4 protein [Bryobacteraceae bacterium]